MLLSKGVAGTPGGTFNFVSGALVEKMTSLMDCAIKTKVSH